MINFVASANTTSAAASSMVVTLPTHSEGDVIVLSFVHNYNSASQQLTAVSEGYTELASLAISGLGHQGAIWYKKAGASEVNPTATYSASSQIMACLASSYSGVDGTVQIDVGPSAWTTEDPGDTTVIAPSVTTTLDGAMLINVATADDNDMFTQPAGMTLVDNLEFISLTVASAYETIATAGATGDRTWTFAQNTDEITAVSFALRPEVATGITVTATLGAIDYTSQSATVGLTGSVDITATLGAISYSSQDTTVSITGDIDVNAALGSINYSSQNTTVSVTGDVDIIATLGAIDYSSKNTTVVLSGLVDVTATLGSIVYNSYPVTVQVGEGQVIGNVTAGFADSIYTAGFAGDIYTAGFKPDTITVSFK